MNVENRIVEVETLTCHVLQDFMNMILKEGWQNELYEKAQIEITEDHGLKEKYVLAYEKMRNAENGIENYSVYDMDITLMIEWIRWKRPLNKKTYEALKKVTENRNVPGLSDEEPEELYLCGLLDLCFLRDFVRAVDKCENDIPNEERRNYCDASLQKIENLKNLLEEERMEMLQKEKGMRKDIQSVLDSDDPFNTWRIILNQYLENYYFIEKKPEVYFEFIVLASDAGIVYAHIHAADYYIMVANGCQETEIEAKREAVMEVERRLSMFYNSGNVYTTSEAGAQEILTTISNYSMSGNEITEGMKEIINGLTEQGFIIEKTDYGTFMLSVKTKHDGIQ